MSACHSAGGHTRPPVDEVPPGTMGPCRACSQAGCRVCDGPDGCLICEEPLLVEASGPDGRGTCVSTCSKGFIESGSLCMRQPNASETASLAFATLEEELIEFDPLVGPPDVSCMATTQMMWSLKGRTLVIRPDSLGSTSATEPLPGQGVFFFFGTGQTSIMANSDIGAGAADRSVPPPEVALFRDQQHNMYVRRAAEAGPVVTDSHIYLGYILCTSTTIDQVVVACDRRAAGSSGEAPCVRTKRAAFPLVGVESCDWIQQVDRQHLVVQLYSGKPFLATFDGAKFDLTPGLLGDWFHMPTLPRPYLMAGPGQLDQAAWSGMWSRYGNMLVGFPTELLAARAAWAPFGTQYIQAPGSPHTPHSMPTMGPSSWSGVGRPARQMVFSSIANGEWLVHYAPGDMAPQGRTGDLPTRWQVLGRLPAAALFRTDHQLVVEIPDRPDTPACLVMLLPNHVGVALYRCGESPTEACHFLRATFTPLELGPNAGHVEMDFSSLLVVRAAGGSTPHPRHLASLMVGTTSMESPAMHLAIYVPCPSGTFGDACQPCDARCRSCTGPGPSECTACRARLAHQPDACLPSGTCPDTMYLDEEGLCGCHDSCVDCTGDPTAGVPFVCTGCRSGFARATGGFEPDRCFACASTCAECSRPDDRFACTACRAGHFLHAGQCVAACPMGTWADGNVAQCVPCSEGCTECVDGFSCDACREGFFQRWAGDQCQRCDGSCVECEDAFSCSTCQPGLVFENAGQPGMSRLCVAICPGRTFLQSGACAACNRECMLCSQEAHLCVACAYEYRWAAGPPVAPAAGASCAPCPEGCEACTEDDRCLSCVWGYYLTEEGVCVDQCPPGTYPDHANGRCLPCEVTCAECTGPVYYQCTACRPGLELVPDEHNPESGGTCQSPCAEGEYPDPAGDQCLACDVSCASCNGPSNGDCWRCQDAADVLQEGVCVQACAPGYVAIDRRCLPCHRSCATCSGLRATECTGTCPEGLFAFAIDVGAMMCVASCPASSRAQDGECQLCPTGCLRCPDDRNTCTQCERTYALHGGQCTSSCPEETAHIGGVCLACEAGCKSCLGPAEDQCTSCLAEAPLWAEYRCMAACPAGSYADAEGASCMPCHVLCQECSGPGEDDCTSCPAERVFFQESMCLLDCPAGFHREDLARGSSPAESEPGCAACDPSCRTCEGDGRCASCRRGQVLLPAGTCGDTCPEGWTKCSMAHECRANPPNCEIGLAVGDDECTIHCVTCRKGWILSAGRCVTACPPGEYHVPGTGHCAGCDKSCRSCVNSATFCTSCFRQDHWLHVGEGVCASACPMVGFAPVGRPQDRVCLACGEGCERCTAPADQPGCTPLPGGQLECPTIRGSCDQCTGALHLLHGQECVAECPPGTFADRDAPNAPCAVCHEKCAFCDGPSAEDCTRRPSRSTSTIGLIVGVVAGVLLVLILLAIVVVLYLRRRAANAAAKSIFVRVAPGAQACDRPPARPGARDDSSSVSPFSGASSCLPVCRPAD
ncbi:hypothetical protein, variant [Fonticula alba]|uniref:EGF-like domain-containing protein n=1 Tax=Fonticula alba TaxID=691883 RepID=A0A058Z298_FONAL|nr:hypothetical protein, variant [Fonticula alba]KCV68385.1 hypothetical protein, variant [Fonticula alba]|eukprot:XP_009497439.1 hypothetical protein, variant [Fonticula alba]